MVTEDNTTVTIYGLQYQVVQWADPRDYANTTAEWYYEWCIAVVSQHCFGGITLSKLN